MGNGGHSNTFRGARPALRNRLDTARLSNAVSRPGIDPRFWACYGTLMSEPYIETQEGQQDIFVDVMLHPNGQIETARVGAIYAGNGFGFYCPLHNEDEVLVLVPYGDADSGLVVTHRLWSPADPPPDDVVDNPEDVTLVVEEDKNLRLSVLGTGNVIIRSDLGKVYLGDEVDTEPVAKGQSLKSYLESIKSAFNEHTHISTEVGTPTLTPSTSFAAPTDALLSETTEVL